MDPLGSPLPQLTNSSHSDYASFSVSVKIGDEVKGIGLKDDYYANRYIKPRGLALILNYSDIADQEPRTGSDKDTENMHQLFDQLGYHVHTAINLKLAVYI